MAKADLHLALLQRRKKRFAQLQLQNSNAAGIRTPLCRIGIDPNDLTSRPLATLTSNHSATESVENRLRSCAVSSSADGIPNVTSRQIVTIQRRVAVSRLNVQSLNNSGCRRLQHAVFLFQLCKLMLTPCWILGHSTTNQSTTWHPHISDFYENLSMGYF